MAEHKVKEEGDLRSFYRTHFTPSHYVSEYYSRIDEEEGWFLFQLHTIFASMEKGNSSISTPFIVLEVGCGPLASGLASASTLATCLVYSDLLLTNLDAGLTKVYCSVVTVNSVGMSL